MKEQNVFYKLMISEKLNIYEFKITSVWILQF